SFRSLEVDRKLVLGWRLHRQVRRLLALEDTIDIPSRALVLVDQMRPVGDQAAAGDEVAFVVDRGQFMPGRQRDDQFAVNRAQRARCQDQAAIRGARETCDGALDLAGVTHVDRIYLNPERGRRCLDGAELPGPGGYGRITDDGDSRHARRDLFKQFQPFSNYAVFELAKSGGVAPRPCQAVDEAGADRVGDSHEHDRYSKGRPLQWLQGGAAGRQDDVRRKSDQFRGVFAIAVRVARAPTIPRIGFCPDQRADRALAAIRNPLQRGTYAVNRIEPQKGKIL